ncbi:Piwi-domain-containing protein [Sporormia fimetaria CBS 119925]|uniref:Piwi-domain-containing protein n=1 Tax=Sporormia fimetaria CBS 119925 TaxID=1340428 RepID=A0A6A6VFP3_9PLEO|nr:Piwi-domain-containing protein [Sporormia fimetaria CBS 119925]
MPPKNQLSDKWKQQISAGKHRNPCIRCDEGHNLTRCANPGSRRGHIWRQLPNNELPAAQAYANQLRAPERAPTGRGRGQQASRAAPPNGPRSGPQATSGSVPSQGTATKSGASQQTVLTPGTAVPATAKSQGDTKSPEGQGAAKKWPFVQHKSSLFDEREQKASPSDNNPKAINQYKFSRDALGGRMMKLTEDIGGAFEFPLRNIIGVTKGPVVTNYFELQLEKPKVVLYEYKIEADLGGRNKRMIKALITRLVNNCDVLRTNQENFATDYFDTIIAWTDLGALLRKPPNGSQPPDDAVNQWQLDPPLPDGNEKISLTLRFEGEVDVDTLQRYTQSDPAVHGWNREPTLKALNIIVSKCFNEGTGGVQQLGANKFYLEDAYERLGSSRSLYSIRGYYYTVKAGFDKIRLNVNTATSAFYRPILVSELMGDANGTWSNMEIEDVLRGLRVYITYERGDLDDTATSARLNAEDSRIKMIAGLGEPLEETMEGVVTKAQTFIRDTTTEVRVIDYLEETDDVTIEHRTLPAVNLGKPDNPRWYAPEHLRIMPYQMHRRTVPERLMGDLLKTACLKPKKVRALIEKEGLGAMRITDNDTGLMLLPRCPALKIDPRMLGVACGILDYPEVQYLGKDGKGILVEPNNDKPQWNLQKKNFIATPKKGQIWSVQLLYEDTVETNTVRTFEPRFPTFVRDYAVGSFRLVQKKAIPSGAHYDKIQSSIKSVQPLPHLVVLLLAGKSAKTYATFKDVCDRELGVHSICMARQDLVGKGDYLGNIMMKANLKSAGVNHTVSEPSLLRKVLENTLVLGADVTHPGSSALIGAPSITAVVGSVDEFAGRFLGLMRLQSKSDKEVIDPENLQSMVADRICDWVIEQDKSALPPNILYYRDGVSEGQYSQIQKDELDCIKKAYNDAYDTLKKKGIHVSPPSDFKLTAIVVAKRHHVRFYPTENAPQSYNNCPPGTYVEQVVTSPYYGDFYLQSHAAIKRNARPAHYFILVDEIKPKTGIEAYRQVTHELCYTYVRSTTGVSYAARTYYADRLCERGRVYLRDLYNPSPRGKPDQDKAKKEKSTKEQKRKEQRELAFPKQLGRKRSVERRAKRKEKRRKRIGKRLRRR